MANVQKRTRKNGMAVYLVQWRTPDGKARTKSGFHTKRAAEQYATTVEFSTHRGSMHDPRSGAVTFRVAAQAWLESRVDLKPRTLAEYAYSLRPRVASTSTTALPIDATFGGWPNTLITRTQIADWVAALTTAGARPSTVRHAYFVVRMVLEQAVVDDRITSNPAENVKLPSERSGAGGTPGVVDDMAQFLTSAQVSALVDATPWPYAVLVHLAGWVVSVLPSWRACRLVTWLRLPMAPRSVPGAKGRRDRVRYVWTARSWWWTEN